MPCTYPAPTPDNRIPATLAKTEGRSRVVEMRRGRDETRRSGVDRLPDPLTGRQAGADLRMKAIQLAFLGDTLVRLARTLDPVLKIVAFRRQ